MWFSPKIYCVTVFSRPVPLAFGVYWKKATNAGALVSIAFGVITWSVLEVLNLRMEAQGASLIVPPQLAGLFMAIVGMLVGSLLPQLNQEKVAVG